MVFGRLCDYAEDNAYINDAAYDDGMDLVNDTQHEIYDVCDDCDD